MPKSIPEFGGPRVFIAPIGDARVEVEETASGRGYTHLFLTRDDENATGVTTLRGRRRCLTPWIAGERRKNGVIVMPPGSSAKIFVNGELLIEDVAAFRPGRERRERTGQHTAMYKKVTEQTYHHIERGSRGGATSVSTEDLSGTITLWTD